MKYFIGWTTFLLIVIFLGVGGFFLVKNLDVSAFEFKDINEVTYQDYDINDFDLEKCNERVRKIK